MTIQLKIGDQRDAFNAWAHTIESKELTRPTSTDLATIPKIRCPYFLSHN